MVGRERLEWRGWSGEVGKERVTGEEVEGKVVETGGRSPAILILA
jgi:hypothetical protein